MKEMSKFEAERQDLANAEKLFDLSITMYTDLIHVQKELSSLDVLFKLYAKQKVAFLKTSAKRNLIIFGLDSIFLEPTTVC